VGDGLTYSTGTIAFVGSSLTTVGTITTGTWQATPIATAYGGTGNLLTTKGDLLTYDTTAVTKVGVGTNGQVLTANSAASGGIDWTTPSSTSIVTAVTNGDGLNLNGGGTLSFIGSSLTTVGTITTGTWQATPIATTYGGTGNLLTTKGDLLTYSTTVAKLGVGTNGQVLTVNSAATNGVDWETPAAAVITSVTTGDGLTLTSGVLSMTGANITTVGTISSGTWNGTVVGPSYGGTGVNNGSFTTTLGGTLSTAGQFITTGAGAYSLVFQLSANTAVQLPTSGTLLQTTGNGSALTNTPAYSFQLLSSDPGSPSTGEVWYNTSSTTFKGTNGLGTGAFHQTLYVNGTTANTITGTSAETAFTNSYTFPANSLVVGTTFRVQVYGSLDAAATQTIDYRIRLGGLSGAAVLDIGALVPLTNTKRFYLDVTCVVLTTGSGGTISGFGTISIGDGNFYPTTAIGLTVNTTTSNVLEATAQWGSSSGTDTTTMQMIMVQLYQ
jgi:hypothetical protein